MGRYGGYYGGHDEHYRPQAYAAIVALGGTHVSASFSGGNDEGGFDDPARLMHGDTLVRTFDPYDESSRGGGNWDQAAGKWVREEKDNDPNLRLLSDELETVLSARYGGFAGEFEVRGTVIIDARTNKTDIESEERSMSDWG